MDAALPDPSRGGFTVFASDLGSGSVEEEAMSRGKFGAEAGLAAILSKVRYKIALEHPDAAGTMLHVPSWTPPATTFASR